MISVPLGSEKIAILLTSADIPRALQQLSDFGIMVYEAESIDKLHLRFYLSKHDLARASQLIASRGDVMEVLHRKGIGHTFEALVRRPILVLSMLCIFLLSYWLPSRVLFVRVEGNEKIPSRLILHHAAEHGISFGASRREVRSEKAKNNLLASMPQLQWAGVNTYGCTAIITVRERNDLEHHRSDEPLCNIIASQNGLIEEITVQQGTALCKVGQVVTKGDILVSAYTDCGICVRVTGAKADILGQTQRNLAVVSPAIYLQRDEITDTATKYSIIIGKKRINFFKGSGISGSTCAKIYEEKYITLPGGFKLPIAIARHQTITYKTCLTECHSGETPLQVFVQNYLFSLMQGGKILRADCVYTQSEETDKLDGLFHCQEMIGIARPEEDYEQSN